MREHWEQVEDQARDHLTNMLDMALPKRRKLTEREQLQRYFSYGPEEFDTMRNWLAEKGKPQEFDTYIARMEKLRSKHAKRK